MEIKLTSFPIIVASSGATTMPALPVSFIESMAATDRKGVKGGGGGGVRPGLGRASLENKREDEKRLR